MKHILLIISFSALTSFMVCKEEVSIKDDSNKESTNISEKIKIENANDTTFYENRDKELYSYIEKEFELNKIRSIKIRKVTKTFGFDRKEYYNVEGELTRIEYLNDQNVSGIVNVMKRGNKYYSNIFDEGEFNLTEEGEFEYSEIGLYFFITKEWPRRQTTVEDKIILEGNHIFGEHISYIGQNDFSLYIQRSFLDDQIDKIYTYHYEYYDSFPSAPPADYNFEKEKEMFKKRQSEIEIVPKLVKISKYKYDENDRLVEVENIDALKNTSTINKLEYNERGIVSKNENGETFEYEYYK